MLFSSGSCHRSTDPPDRSWSAGRSEPATWPRVKSLRLLSDSMPWIIDIKAGSTKLGVTCGDVVDQLGDYLQQRLSKETYASASPEQQRNLKVFYHHNRSRAHGVPGGRLGEGLRRLDWFGPLTEFAGVRRADTLVVQRCIVALPCVFELVCNPRESAEEEEAEVHELRRQRSRSRSTRDHSRTNSVSGTSTRS